jgi:glycosyltransferase involved in cell wall biosynthesis
MDRDRPTSICYILSYYFPDYVRTSTLTEALERMEEVVLYRAINSSTGVLRYFQTLLSLLVLRVFRNPDCYLLGFRGYEIYWLVRIITLGKPLILDHLMSPYDSLLNEKRQIADGSVITTLLYSYEKSILQCSETVLTDTAAHKAYFSQLFQVDPNKIHSIPVSTDETLFGRSPAAKESEGDLFRVLFYGSFLPLHGIDIILEAARVLQDRPIQFVIVGGKGKRLASFRKQLEGLDLPNVIHKKWVDYAELPELILTADLCLGGPFGNTGQARRVITGKTFQFLAMGKATAIGRTDQDHGFKDRENCILVDQGDAEALASAIAWAFAHRHLLGEIGQGGRELYVRDYSIDSIKPRLRTVLQL